MRQGSSSRRVLRGMVWTLAGLAVARILGVVGSILTARSLGLTAFGEMMAVQSTLGLFGTFAGLGLGVTATKYVADLRVSDPARCGQVIALLRNVAWLGGGAATAVLVSLSPWLASRTLAAPHLAPALVWGCGLVLFGTLQGVYSGILGGLEAFRELARANAIASVIGLPLPVLGAWTLGLEGACLGLALQSAAASVACQAAAARACRNAGIRIPLRAGRGVRGILWTFSLPAFASSCLAGPASWACNTLLVNQPRGYGEMALLNAAGQWRNLLAFFPITLASVVVPVFASLHQAGRTDEFRSLLRSQVLVSVGVCLLLAVPVWLLGPQLMSSYGSGFDQGLLVFTITVWGTGVVAANNLMSRAMQACGRAWMDLAFSVVWVAALLGAAVVLIPRSKAVGVVQSHLVASLALALVQWMALRRAGPREGRGNA